MKRLRHVLITFILTGTCHVILHGQYLFTRLQPTPNFSSLEATCLAEDQEGFIWVGAHNGLNRFDGSEVKIFSRAAKNYPEDLSEDISGILPLNGDILVISTRQGLCLFNRHLFTFTIIPLVLPDGRTIHPDITSMTRDDMGSVWIVAREGLLLFHQGKLIKAEDKFHELKGLPADLVITTPIVSDLARQGIWLGTNHGLLMIDFNTGEIHNESNNPEGWPVFRNEIVHAFAIHPATGDIWWSNAYNTLHQCQNGLQQLILHHNLSADRFGPISLKLIYPDLAGNIWLGTWQGRVLVIEPTGRIISLPESSPQPYALPSGFLNDIHQLGNGELWLCTNSGVAKISAHDPVRDIIDLPDPAPIVNSIIRYSADQLILATEYGFYVYHEKNRTVTHTTIPGEDAKGNRIFRIIPFRGEWWCGTGHGIKIYNPATGTFRTPDLKAFTAEVNSVSIMSMIKDHEDHFWFAGWETYIYQYNLDTRQCIRYDGLDAIQGDIGKTNCLDLLEDKEGNIWAGFGERGLRKYITQQRRFVNPVRDEKLDNTVITRLVQHPDGHIWMSSWGNGVFRSDREGRVIDHFTTSDGLVTNLTSGLDIFNNDLVWFSTPESIQYIDTKSKSIGKIPFVFEKGMTDNFPCMFQSPHGLYVSLLNRIALIDTSLIRQPAAKALPLITGISVFGKEKPFSSSPGGLLLRHHENFFSISYSNRYHLDFPSMQYAYILEGFNPDWVYCGRKLDAGFTNVPPGRYTFKVKSSDPSGAWNDQYYAMVVVVEHPFWQENWFYLLCLAILSALVFIGIRRWHSVKEKKKADHIIDYFANSVYGENSVNEICWDIARNCISQLGFEDCVVYLVDEGKNVLEQKAAFGPKNQREREIINPLVIPVGQGIVGHVAANAYPLLINDTTKDARYMADDELRCSELAVPIIHDQKVIGVIDSENRKKDFFTQEHLKTLTTIASISSFKIAEAKTEILAREHELKLLEVNSLFAESQLKALRAQMNPHFVFNCLNSIQECIVTKKYNEASAYLNKFAKLLRQVLNRSGKLLIAIEDEAEILTLYLELEQMRFDHGFQYEMHIDPDLEADDILMPSMFLQPFVENALWHGLMHKQGDRKLCIGFFKTSEDIFTCIIEDNGIGRKKSAELKEHKVLAHGYASKGMKMNAERLEILRHQHYHASMEIIDLYDNTGEPSGTKVIVELSTNILAK